MRDKGTDYARETGKEKVGGRERERERGKERERDREREKCKGTEKLVTLDANIV